MTNRLTLLFAAVLLLALAAYVLWERLPIIAGFLLAFSLLLLTLLTAAAFGVIPF